MDLQPQTRDACLYADPERVQDYRLARETGWVSFSELQSRFSERDGTVPVRYEAAFAPVKVVLGVWEGRLRATVAYEPVYPVDGWLGTLVPGRHLWFAYVAVAVLNTASSSVWERDEGSTSPSGARTLAFDRLLRLPVMPAGLGEDAITEVAHLCHQLTALYDAELESGASFRRQIGATEARLRDAVAGLLEGTRQGSRSRPPAVRLLESGEDPERAKVLEFWEESINDGLPESLRSVECEAEIAA